MKAIRGFREFFTNGRRLEQSGQLPEAAAAYQKIIDADPSNPEAVARLLIVYRKLKEYKKELAVINGALSAYEEHDKTQQQKWLKEHPRAAGASKAILRTLGGASASAFGVDPKVNQLLKRKELVERKVSGKKSKRKKKAAPKRSAPTKNAPQRSAPKKSAPLRTTPQKTTPAPKKTTAAKQHKRNAAAAKKQEKQRKAAEAKRRKEKAAAIAAERKRAAEEKQKQAEAQKAEKLAAKKAAEAQKNQPSLFVITLRYLVPADQIDADLPNHSAWLNKHFAKGNFLISGHQVPRTGDIIIARGKDRSAIERITKQDPFVKKKLASVDIVEFKAASDTANFIYS